MPTDTERIDWLQKQRVAVMPVFRTCRVALTLSDAPRHETRETFVGWSVATRTDELPTWRAAVDAAMVQNTGPGGGTPAAKGGAK